MSGFYRPPAEWVSAAKDVVIFVCVSDSFSTLWPLACQTKACPWNFPGKNTGVGCYFPLHVAFLTPELNMHLLCLLHWQADCHFCLINY